MRLSNCTFKVLKHRKINLSDEDAPEIKNWEEAVVGKFYRPVKKQITVRIDADVLEWFRHATKKYQTLINLARREYMMHHKNYTRKESKSIYNIAVYVYFRQCYSCELLSTKMKGGKTINLVESSH